MAIIIIWTISILAITAAGNIIVIPHGELIITDPGSERNRFSYKQDISVVITGQPIPGQTSLRKDRNSLEKIFQQRHQEMTNCLLLIKRDDQFIPSR